MPSTWPGIEPTTLDIEDQRYTNLPTRSTQRMSKCKKYLKPTAQNRFAKQPARPVRCRHEFVPCDTVEPSVVEWEAAHGLGRCAGLCSPSTVHRRRGPVEGKPRKNINQVTCPDEESNPGHLVSRPDALTVSPQVWHGGGGAVAAAADDDDDDDDDDDSCIQKSGQHI
ncbi:hypothetical protein ANN_13204 [Periplaneta americana]|uniref:Uncharacterized protein n=1 Tax=Periplaneta americana TaxID=6978 RepID=A0ABQ8TL00_PERAM|nr:hypothetical protein ANN_13204 [Periplaneta americana]